MNKVIIYLLFMSITVLAQEKKSDYFSFSKEGEKHLKPIKYILYKTNKKNKKQIYEDGVFFYIEGESFQFIKNKHDIHICDIKYLEKIKLSKAEKLVYKEFEFYKKKREKEGSWKHKISLPPMPLNKLHSYFKVFIIEKDKNTIIKYEVDWNYTGTRGFKMRRNK